MLDILQTSEYGCFKKTKHAKFSEKIKHLLTPDTHTQGVKNVRFLRKFGVLCFLETPVLRFILLPYYRRADSDLVLKFFALLRLRANVSKEL